MSVAAEKIGRIESWRSETGSSLDGTPLISREAWGGGSDEPRLEPLRSGDQTPVLSMGEEGYTFFDLTEQPSWERLWIPWAFEPSPRYTVGTSNFAPLEAGPSLHTAWSTAAETTTTKVLPATGVFRLVSPGAIAITTTTPLWEEAATLVVKTPGLVPRMVRLRESVADLFDSLAKGNPRAADAVSAMSDLMRWLNRDRDEVADICRFATRTSQYWSTGKKPRPATVRRLFEVHSFVASLVRAVGRSQAREWLEGRPNEEASRLEILATEEGLTRVIRDASSLLFTDRVRGERPRPESIEAAEAASIAEEFAPIQVKGEPRRPRRPPSHAT